MEKLATWDWKWAIGLLLIPVIGQIAGPILFSKANNSRVEAAAAQRQADHAYAAIRLVRDVLLQALEEFIEGMYLPIYTSLIRFLRFYSAGHQCIDSMGID